MNNALKHIPLAVAVEIAGAPRPPASTLMLDREAAERFGGLLAEDLAHTVATVTRAHLVTGPALLSPGRLLTTDSPAWAALGRMARFEHGFAPGITSIGTHQGRPPDPALAPSGGVPDGRLLMLPALLVCLADDHDELVSALERELFERASLRPPSLATLAEATGLQSTHGQWMTRADALALVKMQLAAAGLDPFWPPLEHALITPDQALALDLPAGLAARWMPDARRWQLEFRPIGERSQREDWALWLRSLRQTVALLDVHAIDWQIVTGDAHIRIDPGQRWVEQRQPAPTLAGRIEHPQLGLIGWALDPAADPRWLVPLRREATTVLGERVELPAQPRLALEDP